MKKTLLLALTAMAGVVGLNAQEIVENVQITGMAPNGELAAGMLFGNVTIVNPKTGEVIGQFVENEETGEYYDGCNGNYVSNTGIVLGSTSTNTDAAWWKNGLGWSQLQVPNPEMVNLSSGITPDGTVIVGSIGLIPLSLEDTEVPMTVPAMWELGSDGSYGMCKQLPYPAKDFTGRVPQYVLAQVVSADGGLIAGQVMDYSGMFPLPIFWSKDGNGEWQYTKIGWELANPDNLEFPEFPGDAPKAPDPKDYMTDEQREAYQNAIDSWDFTSGDPYPDPKDYMTDEAKAQYDEAVAAWNKEKEEWQAKYDAFDEVLMQCFDKGTPLEFNITDITSDGKLMLQDMVREEFDPETYSTTVWHAPIVFDLAAGTYKKYSFDQNMNASHLLADGTIIGFVSNDQTLSDRACMYRPGQDEYVWFDEVVKSKNSELYAWMEENMRHDVTVTSWDEETGDMIEDVIEGVWCTGRPVATPDGNVWATYTENTFDMSAMDQGIFLFGYTLPNVDMQISGIGSIADEKAEAPVKYYNLQGVEVKNPAAGQILIRRQGDKSVKVIF